MSFKKILIILIIVLIVVIGLLAVYNFLFKEETTPEPSPTPTTPTPSPQPAGQIKAVSQEPVLGVTVDKKKVKYYSTANGNVFQSDFDGSNLSRISSNVISGLLKVIWSVNQDKVITIVEDNGQTKKYFYDYNTGISTALNRNIRWVSWSPKENRIAYQYYNSQSQKNNISIADPDGTNWTNVFSTRMKDLIVEWPSTGQISIRTKPSGLAQSVVYTISLANGDFQKILDQTYGLTVLWSPLGDKLLFSETDSRGKNLKLKIADLAKSTIHELDLVTLPEKCVWSQDNRTIFCAIPKTISNLAVLPDDYYKGLITFADDFLRINLDTGEKRQIFTATGSYDAQQLLLPPLEDYLLFVNKKDNLLYSLEL